jgi:hypothetical protein
MPQQPRKDRPERNNWPMFALKYGAIAFVCSIWGVPLAITCAIALIASVPT